VLWQQSFGVIRSPSNSLRQACFSSHLASLAYATKPDPIGHPFVILAMRFSVAKNVAFVFNRSIDRELAALIALGHLHF
jgi:hypothetical protein